MKELTSFRYVYVVTAVDRYTGEDEPSYGLWCAETAAEATEIVQALNRPGTCSKPPMISAGYYARLAGRFERATKPLRRGKKKGAA